MSTRERGKQGLASMPYAKRREIAAMGGRASHAKGTAHRWTKEEATVAGAKGVASRRRKTQQRRNTTEK
jgi:general stress protein YciG